MPSSGGHRPGPDSAEAIVSRIDAAKSGDPPLDTVPTGYPSLDRVLGGGFRRQDLVLLVGDTGSGKSALGLGIALRSALAGTPVVYYSGEMTEDRLMERALAMEGRAPVDDLRTGRLADASRSALGAAAVRLRDLPLVIRRLSGGGFEEVAGCADMVPRRALVVVDPLQMVAPPSPGTTLDESEALAIRALKALALERNLAVLALSALRHFTRRDDSRPTLDDLGGAGAARQHADIVLALYREEMYRPGTGVEGAAELLLAKNRNGPGGFVDLYFYRQWLRFEDMLDPDR